MNDNIQTMSIELVDSIVDTGDVPDKYLFANSINDNCVDQYTRNFRLRKKYTARCSWCLVNNMWVKQLADLLRGSNCLEIYGGKGLLSHQLRKQDIKIRCTDKYDSLDNPYINHAIKYTDIEIIDALSAVQSYEPNTLDFVVASWIPYEDKTCIDVAIELYKNQKNCKIVYIGEDFGGCTASEEFFDYVEDISDHEEYRDKIANINKYYQTWDGVYDYVMLLKPISLESLIYVKSFLEEKLGDL